MTNRERLIGAGIATAAFGSLVFLSGNIENPVRCALIDSGAVKEYRVYDGKCPPDPKGKPEYRFLPAPKADRPEYDPATQVREGPVATIGDDAVTESWTVRDKTPDELAAETADRVQSINSVVFRVLCRHENEIRSRAVPPQPRLDADGCRAAFMEDAR